MNPLQFPVLLVGEVVSFCVDMVLMAIYAFLTAFALCAVFLGLTTLGPIFATLYPLFARKESKVAGWRFPFESLKASRRRAKAKAHATRPPTLSHRWTVYTWKVLHVKRFDGISPFVLFLSVFVPAVLLCFLLHHRRQVTKVREAETLKRLSAEQELLAAQKICEQHAQPVDSIRSSLKCGLCTRAFSLPYTLAPCGHTFDLHCLQHAFRNAPPSPLDLRCQCDLADLPSRQKLCPQCRVEVTAPPALAWAVKIVADAVAATDDEPMQAQGDPWKGIFRPRPVLTVAAGVAAA